MGSFIFFLGRRILEGIIIFLVITFLPGLPPSMNFTSYSVSPPLPLEGTLAPNARLNNAEHLFEGLLHGPECITSFNGELYTGLHGGNIVKIESERVVPVAKLGQPCGGFWEEELCGRPLGLKFDKGGALYVADAYYGIFKINIKTGSKTLLVSPSTEINGKTPLIPNSLDVSSDGTLYWSDSSTDMKLYDGVFTMLGDGTGRLLKYDPKNNRSQVLIDKLHFANGVILSPNEDFVLVSESFRSRIHRYYLKGLKKGTHDIFADRLPGIPDNLNSDNHGGYYVPLGMTCNEKRPLISDVIGPYYLLRKFVARLFALVEYPFKQIEMLYPNYLTKRVTHLIGHFEFFSFLHPKHSLIIHLDVQGKILESLHALDGTLHGISDVHLFEGSYYIGSPFNTYIGRVRVQDPNRIKIHIKQEK